MKIIDLPPRVSQLLEKLNSPNRLKRHLQIVYTTARELLISATVGVFHQQLIILLVEIPTKARIRKIANIN